jgi:hypothetical protein
MKHIFTILFLIIYLILSVGMNILVHTCSGESTATIATTKAVDPCVCEDETSASQPNFSMADMCCTTELKTVQIDDAQTITPANIEQNLVAAGILPTIEISTFDTQRSSFIIFNDTSPPPDKDYQISNSVFLI